MAEYFPEEGKEGKWYETPETDPFLMSIQAKQYENNFYRLRSFFFSQGVPAPRAIELAALLYHLPIEHMESEKREDFLNFIYEWANVGLADDYDQVISTYKKGYNLATGEAQGWENDPRRVQLLNIQTQKAYQKYVEEGQAYERGQMVNAQVADLQQRERKEARGEREMQWAREVGEMPSAEAASAPFLERVRTEVSPAAQKWYERNMARMFQEQGMGQQRRAWWEDLSRMPHQYLTEMWTDLEPGEKSAREEMMEVRGATDPWAIYLRNLDAGGLFQKLSPEERGYYPRKFRPPTRVLR